VQTEGAADDEDNFARAVGHEGIEMRSKFFRAARLPVNGKRDDM